MANFSNGIFKLPVPGVPSPDTPISLNQTFSSSVFLSPDKTSLAELKFRTCQANNLARHGLINLAALSPNNEISQMIGNQMHSVVRPIPQIAMPQNTKPVPALGHISENDVREILEVIKVDYPFAEGILASKMSPDQFRLVLERFPKLKQIIEARMSINPSSAAATTTKSTSLASPPADLELPKGERNTDKKFSMRFVEFLYQIKRFSEVGLLDEEILDEPMSPVTMSMIYSLLVQVKKLSDLHRAQLCGKVPNPEEEMAIRKRLREMKEYIREEQKMYLESMRNKPGSMEQLLKKV